MKVFLHWVIKCPHPIEKEFSKTSEWKRESWKTPVAVTIDSVTGTELLREMGSETMRQVVRCALAIPVWMKTQSGSRSNLPFVQYPQRVSVSGGRLVLYPEDTEIRRPSRAFPKGLIFSEPSVTDSIILIYALCHVNQCITTNKNQIKKVSIVGSRVGMKVNICCKEWGSILKTVGCKSLKHYILTYTCYVRETDG